MSIIYNSETSVIHLQNKKISYIMEVVDNKYLIHRYFGKKIEKYYGSSLPQYFKRGYTTEHSSNVEFMSFDDFPFEYPTNGSGDYRIPSISITQENGISHISPIYKSYSVTKGKPNISGLPHTFGDLHQVETLQIVLEDDIAKVRVYLYYSLFENHSIVARHQKIENYGENKITIDNVKSMSLELPSKDYEFISLYGTHANEANKSRFKLHQGIQKINSLRGSSSHQHQPFFALVSPNTTYDNGEVYAFHFIYSGNFEGCVEVDQFGNVRAQIGLNPEMFSWDLEPKECFETPEAILNYSSTGLNGMSQEFHELYLNHLTPQRFKNTIRPILLNSWEAMYYDVSMEKIMQQVGIAKDLGIELFVLDDGWFRKGNSSHSSMGDWLCNKDKLNGGIQQVSEFVHNNGLLFGLWFEPEAVSKDSILYQEHSDWVLQIPDYPLVEGRHELVLDLSQKCVQEYIINTLSTFLSSGDIDYIKWDMNRPLTNVNSLYLNKEEKKEVSHRYILGLYRVLDVITKKFPNVLIEGCSSGGARFDPGMLYYVAQNWASDNTDGVDRVNIQDGFSLLYPPLLIGAHVSSSPNHQTGRVTSLRTRYEVAKLFNLGYELDLTKCTDIDRNIIRDNIREYKEIRKMISKGDFFHNDVPNNNYVMWSIVSKEKDECIINIFQKLHNTLLSHGRFLVKGVKPSSEYVEVNSGIKYSGEELMNIGLTVPLVKEDFYMFIYHLKEVVGKC